MTPSNETRANYEKMKEWVWDSYKHTHPEYEEKIKMLFARMYELGWNAAIKQMNEAIVQRVDTP